MVATNKKKIINDPVYGFITIPSPLIYDVIAHPWFQRMRYIKQLGLTHYVYPGALHTRFHHALGAMHLMGMALDSLRAKGITISAREHEAAQLAILLHDIGHGPFSHALEYSLVQGIPHEDISAHIMQRLNLLFKGRLQLTISMFNGTYHRGFFNQLVSGQLDLDRMDYLNRDSFFTGVSEGVIGTDRIIKMMNVRHDELVVEEKGVYSIEKFLVARRLMYWQVYLHKTVVAAEHMLINILRRAREVYTAGITLETPGKLGFFLARPVSAQELFNNTGPAMDNFLALDDQDIHVAIKSWAHSTDFVLSNLCRMLAQRQLLRTAISDAPPAPGTYESLVQAIATANNITIHEAAFFTHRGVIENRAYNTMARGINILQKDGNVISLGQASDLSNMEGLNINVKRYVFCQPRSVHIK